MRLPTTIADDVTAQNGAGRPSGDSRAGSNGQPERTPHPYEAQARIPLREAQEGLLGVTLGRAGDPDARSLSDYEHLIHVVGRHGITGDSFSLPGFGVVFDCALDLRAQADGLPASVPRVFAELLERSKADGATAAYGIDPIKHLHAWTEKPLGRGEIDLYAWTVAGYAEDRATERTM